MRKSPIAGQSPGRVTGREVLAGVIEGAPGGGEAGPSACDALVEALAVVEVIVARSEPVERAVTIRDPLEQVGRQQAALRVDGLEQITGPQSAPAYTLPAGSRT
jgi:hypothetical protein